jgi:vacuolar-type H+-ATPase subunit E/Vma4
MEAERQEDRDLLSGIGREAELKAEELAEAAADYARSRAESARSQAREILLKAEDAAEAQSRALLRNAESRAAVETRKAFLRGRDGLIQETLEAARRLVAAAAEDPGYRDVLRGWIVEAAVGLSEPEARVNASREELARIMDGLLRDAEREVLELTGKPVRLSRVEGDPLPAQGVVLTAEGGRLAYNNQAPVRFLRAQSEIRKQIHAVLFGEGA